MRRNAVWLGWLAVLAVPGCACDVRPPADVGPDTITCPTIEEELAAAYPMPVAPSTLWNDPDVRGSGRSGGWFAPDLLQSDAEGRARVISDDVLFEVRPDGVQSMRLELVGDTEFIMGATAAGAGEAEVARLLFHGLSARRAQSMMWAEFGFAEAGVGFSAPLMELDLETRFASQRDGPNRDVQIGSVLLHEGSHVWLVRQPRYQDAAYWQTDTVAFVHLIRADGSEPFGPEGLRLRRPVRYEETFETSYEVGADGSLLYLADWAPLTRELGDPPPPVAPDGDRRGPRVVRVTPDGAVTISPLLVDPATITGTAQGPDIASVWSSLDEEGRYLVHFGVRRADVNSWASVFARVSEGGVIDWTRMTPEPYTASLPGSLFRDPPVAYDGEGGIAFAMTNGFAPYEIRIGHLDGEGTWLLGEEGMEVESFPPTTRFPDSGLYNLEMDVDGEGGYFVLWIHQGVSDWGRSRVNRYSATGERLWPDATGPVSQARPEFDYGTELTIRHDGHGGAWFMTNDGRSAALQHLDGSGRALFWYTSRYPPGNYCWQGRLPIVAWPDPDAPPIPYWDGAPYEPRATIDAGTDSGADLDAGTSMDAALPDAPEDAGVEADGAG